MHRREAHHRLTQLMDRMGDVELIAVLVRTSDGDTAISAEGETPLVEVGLRRKGERVKAMEAPHEV